MPALLGGRAHAILAADEEHGAEPLLDEGGRGADDLLLLALGEHHALGASPQPLEHAREHASHRIAPRAQLLAIRLHVDDRLARDAGVHRGLGDRGRDCRDQPRVERHRNDVVGAEFRPRAVGRRDLVRHVLACERGQRACAAAIFISMLMVVARTSSAPRKI